MPLSLPISFYQRHHFVSFSRCPPPSVSPSQFVPAQRSSASKRNPRSDFTRTHTKKKPHGVKSNWNTARFEGRERQVYLEKELGGLGTGTAHEGHPRRGGQICNRGSFIYSGQSAFKSCSRGSADLFISIVNLNLKARKKHVIALLSLTGECGGFSRPLPVRVGHYTSTGLIVLIYIVSYLSSTCFNWLHPPSSFLVFSL